MTMEQTVIGQSSAIKKVVAMAEKIAQSSSITTLVTGESGTGKEVVARLIHDLSSSESQPFVDINCGAIPETLLESELFGYEKGAFTGATARKQGLFEMANGGTIFLDEIGDVSHNIQVKLLKAVENKRFRRVSGLEEVRISTRIIAATNVDLRRAVDEGKFREDLYYRLNVCQIHIPSLRERGDDVLILAQHFIEQLNGEYDREVKGLTEPARRLLLTYGWPGNVRELRNVLERAVLVECDDWIEPEHLCLESPQSKPTVVGSQVEAKAEMPGQFSRFEIPPEGIALEEIERNIILSALEQADGNISKASRLLRINRGKLRYRLERLNISLREVHTIKANSYI